MNRTIRIATLAVCVVALQPLLASAMTVFSDDFSDAGGSATGLAALGASPWVGAGPESKADNDVDDFATSFAGKLGWDDTGAGFFDNAAVEFADHTLTSIGDYISLSLVYTTRGTVDEDIGVRIRLYDRDDDTMHANGPAYAAADGGYGVNLSSGTNAGLASYRSFTTADAPGGNGDAEPLALSTVSTFGDGGSVVLTATKTGAAEVTLSGSWSGVSGAFAFADEVAGATTFNFDGILVGVGSRAHGIEIDNVLVTAGSVPEPSTLALLSFGLVACAAGRRSHK